MATDMGGAPETELTQDAKNWAMFCHLGGLAAFVGPGIANIVVPVVVWILKRPEHPYIDDQGKEAINFQITMSIAFLICVPLFFVVIGFFLAPLVAIFHLVFTIIGAVKASNGEWYRYPIAIRLVN
jgi:uncharacterized protein